MLLNWDFIHNPFISSAYTDDKPAVSDVLSKTTGINPLVEVWIDMKEGKVIDMKEMLEIINYDGIPEAIY